MGKQSTAANKLPKRTPPPPIQGRENEGRIIPSRKGRIAIDIRPIENGKFYEGDCFNLTRKLPMALLDIIFMHPTYIPRAYTPSYSGSKKKSFEIHQSAPEDRYWSRELQREYPDVHRVCVLLRDLYREDIMIWAVWLAWRILDARRVLSKTGRLWVCCPLSMEHGVKLLLTAIFGNAVFQEILWLCPKNPGYIHNILSVKNDDAEVNTSEPVFDKDILSVTQAPMTEWDEANKPGYNLPVSLMKHILEIDDPAGKLVLESFGGSGTFSRAAYELGSHWIYAENDPRMSKQFCQEFANPSGATRFPKVFPIGNLQTRRSVTHDLVKAPLYISQQGVCPECEREIPLKDMTVDHIFPRSRGGPDDPRNLRLLCRECNQRLANSNLPDE